MGYVGDWRRLEVPHLLLSGHPESLEPHLLRDEEHRVVRLYFSVHAQSELLDGPQRRLQGLEVRTDLLLPRGEFRFEILLFCGGLKSVFRITQSVN